MKIFNLPDLGEGLPDAEIHSWHVKEGDIVKVDDLMVSMETAKAVVEVPAPWSGRIVKLYGKAGDIIKTGMPLVEFEQTDASTATHPDNGTVAGKIEVGHGILHESAAGVTSSHHSAGIKAIPAVRALAKHLQIDLTTVTPTGSNGQITAEDIHRAQENSSQPTTPNIGCEPLRGVRRAMALAMIQSHTEVVPVTLMDDVDLNSWPPDTDITLRILRAIAAGCQSEPALNAWFNRESMSRRLHTEINIGIAIDSEEGLFVPVLKDAGKVAPATLRTVIDRFKEQVKTRSIPQADLRDATILFSNFGTFAGRYANPIIIPPVVAILGTGRIREEAVVHEGKIAIHRRLPLSLTVDHRAVTGGEATRFLAAVMKDLE